MSVFSKFVAGCGRNKFFQGLTFNKSYLVDDFTQNFEKMVEKYQFLTNEVLVTLKIFMIHAL